jgi:hypothetical protein
MVRWPSGDDTIPAGCVRIGVEGEAMPGDAAARQLCLAPQRVLDLGATAKGESVRLFEKQQAWRSDTGPDFGC